MKTKDDYLPLYDIPNRDGFQFIGLRVDSTEARCVVRKDEKMHAHFVDGEARFVELKAWRFIKREDR